MGKFGKAVKKDDYHPVPGKNEPAVRAPVSLWRLLAESRSVAWLLVGASAALFASTVASLAVPALFGRVIDSLAPAAPDAPPASSAAAAAALQLEVVALVSVSLANASFSFLSGYLFAVAGERVVARLRRRVFASLMRQEVGFYDQARVGELLSRLGGDTALLKDAATSNISMALRWGATVVGGTAYLLFVSWRLTLVMLAIVPAVAISARLYGKYVKALSKSVRQALAEATQVAEESMSAVRTVRAFANEPRQEAAYAARVDATLSLGIRAALASGLFNGGTAGVTSLAFIAIVYYGGTLVLAGDLSSGALTSFLLYAMTIGGALSGLAGLFGSIMAAVGACERVFQILDRVPIVPCSEGETVPATLRGEIEFKDVTFAYPSRPDARVLSRLSLRIPAGSVAALVGPSGGGKSTIIALIERWYDADEGAVLLDGRPLAGVNGAALRKRIGLVQQEPTLFAASIADNIRFGRPNATHDEMVAAARVANAHDFISAFPKGYDELVGERGVRLSGGQKQRIAIARSVLLDPKIILLDEATSALDAESEHAVKEALERLMRDKTVVIVAHRLSTVRAADVVFVIAGGAVLGQGTHDELLRSNALYANLVRRQLLSAATMTAELGGGAAAPPRRALSSLSQLSRADEGAELWAGGGDDDDDDDEEGESPQGQGNAAGAGLVAVTVDDDEGAELLRRDAP